MWEDEGLNIPLAELPPYRGQRRTLKSPSKSLFEHQIVGADTETVEGCADLFSWETPHRGAQGLTFTSHVEQVDSIFDVMRCCISAGHRWKKGGKKGWTMPQFFFWNLKFDCQAVFKLLSIRAIEMIISEGEVVVNAHTGDFLPEADSMVRLSYLEGKAFTMTPLEWKVNEVPLSRIQWWDISQYYGKQRLNQAAKKFLNESKLEECFDGSVLDASQFGSNVLRLIPEGDTYDAALVSYYDYYQQDIRTYAEKDAELTGRLARLKASQWISQGVRFIQPFSIANTAQRHLLDMGYFPTLNILFDTEDGRSILAAFLASYHGGLFEVAQTGFIPDVILEDLVSAYPFVMYHLPAVTQYNPKRGELAKGSWYFGAGREEWEEGIEGMPYASLGVVEVYFEFDESLKWFPLTMKAETGTLITPRVYSGWITLEEYREAVQWPHDELIVGRWALHSDRAPLYPFREWIEHHYETKHRAEAGSVARQVAKDCLNSGYGKTIQNIDNVKPGVIYNPIYAATITGATRARMMEFNRLNGFAAVSLATDGIMLERKDFVTRPPRPAPAPYDLGEWDSEGEGDAYVLMSGVYSVVMPNGKVKSTFRGTASYPFLEHLSQFGTRDAGSWLTFFESHANRSIYRTKKARPNSLKEAATQRKDMCAINVFEERSYSLRPAGDSSKRIWERKPRTFGQLLTERFTLKPHNIPETAISTEGLTDG